MKNSIIHYDAIHFVNLVYYYLYNKLENNNIVLEKYRNRAERSLTSIGFLFLNKKKFYSIVFGLLFSVGTTTLSHSIYGNTMMVDVSKNSMANTQVQFSTMDENIVDLKVSERNGNFVWTSMNGKVNPDLDLKSGTRYTFQIESMDNNNIAHQLIIQTESGKQLIQSDVISNDKTDDLPFTFSEKGKYQYHCQYHPNTMHGNIIVS
jgi:plastocyanin